MKRNMAPLLAIAFIVAAISTGVFYGLFAGHLKAAAPDLPARTLVVAARDLPRGAVLKIEDLRVSEIRASTEFKGAFDSARKLAGATLLDAARENQPLTDSMLALGDAASAGGGVPRGMRAVSIRVYESTGVLPLLRRGSKVDIQAVTERNGVMELSPLLQDIEVLSAATQLEQSDAPRAPRGSAQVVTVLTRPLDSDVLALADSGTRLRIALRAPLDDAVDSRHALGVADLFRFSGPLSADRGSAVKGR